MNKYIYKFSEEIGLIQIINRHFWKSKLGPISSLVLSVFFMSCYRILNDGNDDLFPGALSSYISFSILPLTLITMPQLIIDFKSSIILRKISISKITPIYFIFIIYVYYFIASIFSCLIVLSFFSLISWNMAPNYFSKINWWYFIYSFINIFLVASSIGVLMGVFVKRNNIIQLIGIIVMLISTSLVGQLLPPTIIYKKDILRYISLVSPLTYPLSLMNNTTMIFSKWADFNPSTIFEFNKEFYISYFWNHSTNLLVCEVFQKYLNIIFPYVFFILFNIISIKKFNWTSR